MAASLRALIGFRVNPARTFVALALGGPVLAGLALTLAPAFGYLPAIGGGRFNLAPWRELLAEPGFAATLRLTLVVGFAATLLSLGLAFGLLAASGARAKGRGFAFLLAPLLATPHAAMAIGLAFLIAPSGWIFRLSSPWATGFLAPPDFATVNDAAGLALILGLVLKETPFLLIVAIGALETIGADDHFRVARSLGEPRIAAWLKVVAPQLYTRMRLPIYATLAYSLSTVDMGIVLGPSHPLSLSLLSLRWFAAPDLDKIFPGAAAATLQLVVAVAAVGCWRGGEALVSTFGVSALQRGRRGGAVNALGAVLAGLGGVALALGLAALAALAVWSFAWRWTFPNAWPETWTSDNWRRGAIALTTPLGDTLLLAAASASAALVVAVAWLESDDRRGRPPPSRWIYLPLLLPQISFLFGAQSLLAWTRLDGSLTAVAWAHTLFVFPYTMLSLERSWRALDPRYARAAASLGASKGRILFRVKLPIQFRALAIALAIGVSVSFAQYLSTLFAGGGRVTTLTTEAIARASGGDRRFVAVAAFLQAAIPVLVYLWALLAPMGPRPAQR